MVQKCDENCGIQSGIESPGACRWPFRLADRLDDGCVGAEFVKHLVAGEDHGE